MHRPCRKRKTARLAGDVKERPDGVVGIDWLNEDFADILAPGAPEFVADEVGLGVGGSCVGAIDLEAKIEIAAGPA